MWKLITDSLDTMIHRLTAENIFTNYLGLARSILALSLLLTLLFNHPDTLFRPGGVAPEKIHYLALHRFNFFYLLPYEYIHVLTGVAMIILLLVIAGWNIGIMAVLQFWVAVSYCNVAVMIEGGDQVISNISLLLIPICLCDPRKNHWYAINYETLSARFAAERKLIANCFHKLIRIQVAVIYFHAAAGKMPVEQWADGTAVYYWFNNPTFGMCEWMRTILMPLLVNPFTVVLITWGVIGFEWLLFMGMSMHKRYRVYLLIAALLFHFGIIAIHGLFSFFLAMAGALLLYLAPVYRNFSYTGIRLRGRKKRLPNISDTLFTTG
ncbi:hypothetical protein KTO58_18420 [Chitinophaga pendula]|uniref:sporulation-delaying protein SdpB family protein n=1 Tax=Chitinophaga TaxID=79328 RepID=UPI000BAF6D0B|nr:MULTISPECIES: sporulation-delaying protein SdpB family protein [Chitinophaga]ASZ11347.1 hypothetical protein CK934_10395 [Chitinophaga sp. MD30]UCJ05651.1 hypothetical protein KTO58_18420 [Chitinophaga pendula]